MKIAQMIFLYVTVKLKFLFFLRRHVKPRIEIIIRLYDTKDDCRERQKTGAHVRGCLCKREECRARPNRN